MNGDVQWPLDLLVGELRAMRTLACNEAADRLREAAVAGDALAADLGAAQAVVEELGHQVDTVLSDLQHAVTERDALAAEVARLTAEVERLNARRLRDPNERIS